MATYEYICLACEHPFEERRPMSSVSVDTALACPSCGSDRVRRRFSFSTATGSASGQVPGGCCGGGCGCSN
ncbi:MAG: zinc ribbon domain-containing protein [Actinobacteria bacterium]|nr:MAG: zinc ribbon domain-containing protein [Actinomycetota bacterium]